MRSDRREYSGCMDRSGKGRIYLVGFMGSGKSSAGKCLARDLGVRFVDLDERIELASGLSVAEIFEREGEGEFRRREAAALRETESLPAAVIATGGGTLTRRENRDFIQRTGTAVWLTAPLDVMLDRCRGGARRPLLSSREKMALLLEERLAGYSSAPLRIETEGLGPQEVAQLIALRLQATA